MTEPSRDEQAPRSFSVTRGDVRLAGEQAGDGPAILLLHGLTATRRYVVHGSRLLEREGYRVVTYDARGHGASSAAPAYDYDELIGDAIAVLDELGIARAAVAGQSMGAATAAGLALRAPERVAALVLVTPAHHGRPSAQIERWDALADGLEDGGPEGFLDAMGPLSMPERWRAAVRTVIIQRLQRHEHPDAITAALRGVQRSRAFDGLDALAEISVPTLVVGSRDEIDEDHPLDMAADYARRIPGAELVVEDEGESPLAWRGGALSGEILRLLQRASWIPAATRSV